MADPLLVFTILAAAIAIFHALARLLEIRKEYMRQKRLRAVQKKIERLGERIDRLGTIETKGE